MKRKFFSFLINYVLAILALAMTFDQTASAQWSHKEGDPIPHPDGYLVQPFTKAGWEASNYAPEKDIQWFRDAKVGFLAQFGLSTHNYVEVSWGLCYTRKAPDHGHGPTPDDIWPTYAKELKFEKFNAKEWVELMQRSGFKYFVAQAKHHEGFHWWDTGQSDFKVTNTPFGRDLLKEQADACHAAGMPFGIYYCQREWHHPDYCPVDTSKVVFTGSLWWKLKPGEVSPMGSTHHKYLEYNKKAVRELLTQYGKVDIFWWDAAWWGGMFTAEMWDAENLTRMVRDIQPDILENNRASVPGDFDTPEQRLGNFQNWRLWETCMPLAEEWANPRSPLKPLSQLVGSIVHNVCCDGNIMFGFGPQWDGSFTEAQKTRLFELGNWLKQNDSSIYATRGGPWKFSDWGGSTYRGTKVYLHIIQWNGETLRLPAIPGRKVMSSRLLSGESVSVMQTSKVIEITVPHAKQDSIDTVVELTMDKSVDVLKAIESGSVSFFDTSTYGHVVSLKATVTTSSRGPYDEGNPNLLVSKNPTSDYAFRTAEELNPWVQIDLGREINVTNVRVMNPLYSGEVSTLHLSVSIDGKAWVEVCKANTDKALLEFPINGFLAGALVPGIKTRYIRMELKSSKPETLQLKQVEVWGK